jgi:zinc transport system substrate-binding protein
VARLRQARVFVYNGAGFEPWAEKVIGEAAGPALVVVAASAGLARAPVAGGPEVDPHVWLDPVLAQGEVEAIRGALERGDPAGKAVYDANARAFQAKLAALHERFQAGLRECARREVVVTHRAFSYLTRRYQLEQVAVMGLAPESEPSPAGLAAIVRFARQRKVTAIFLEPLVSPRQGLVAQSHRGSHGRGGCGGKALYGPHDPEPREPQSRPRLQVAATAGSARASSTI